jgi:hypothetical protein
LILGNLLGHRYFSWCHLWRTGILSASKNGIIAVRRLKALKPAIGDRASR